MATDTEGLATAMKSQLSLTKQPPRDNFPLPREFRDETYAYLLKGVRTTCKYHFHTNVLAVNRTVHDKTEEFLYKNNTSVVVSLKWPDLEEDGPGLACFPVVSEHRVASLKHHSYGQVAELSVRSTAVSRVLQYASPIQYHTALATLDRVIWPRGGAC